MTTRSSPSRAKSLVSWGHDWVVLCLVIVHPFWAPTRVFALPIAIRLDRNRQGLTKGKKGTRGRNESTRSTMPVTRRGPDPRLVCLPICRLDRERQAIHLTHPVDRRGLQAPERKHQPLLAVPTPLSAVGAAFRLLSRALGKCPAKARLSRHWVSAE